MKQLILYNILIHKYFSRRRKGTEDTKKTEILEFFLCGLCVHRASVRCKQNKIFAVTDYEYKGEDDV
jgi:aminoglycoside phosphotransferase family enzyme